jgi:hypothetical protein
MVIPRPGGDFVAPVKRSVDESQFFNLATLPHIANGYTKIAKKYEE